jgi:2-polyprenyl-3-methyl-5-hydroxy-6-metoxy-1,4-benzoquinol methylase
MTLRQDTQSMANAYVMASQHAGEVRSGRRFEFGQNWSRFLRTITPERVHQAETALQNMLGLSTLAGRTFLDIGSGSGLASLAARNLGASVFSIDYDPQSVACTARCCAI